MDRFGRTAFLSEAARPTTQHYKILVMAWAGWLFDFYDLLLYSFLLSPIGVALRLTHLELSYLLGASLAATAVGGVLFGWLSDRWGRKTVLCWTILTYSVGTLLSGLAPNFLGLFLARLLTGIVTGVGTGLFSGYGSLFTELFPTAIRNTAMGAAFNLARGVQFFTPRGDHAGGPALRPRGRHRVGDPLRPAHRRWDLDLA
jgi:MFS family permease